MVTKPGLTKLNIATQSGSLNAMKASFSSATRAHGISYGIMAQRSIFSTSALTNPKLAYGAAVANARAMLNAPRPMMFAGVMPHQCNTGDDTMNKFMMGMMALNMVAEMTKGITAGIKDIKASRADRTEKKTNTETQKAKEKEVDYSSNNITSSLAKADTSKGLKASLADMSKAIDTLDSSIKENNESIKEEQKIQSDLNSEISNLNTELSTLKQSLTEWNSKKIVAESCGADTEGLKEKITEISNKITEISNKIAKKETQLQNSKSCEQALQNEKSKFETELADKKNTKATYEAKLPKMEQKEKSELTKLQSKMFKLKQEYNSETKDDKKAKIATEYTSIAKNFNEILSNSTCEDFQPANLSLN